MKKHNAGMSLVEVLVAIVLLGAMTVPICTSLVVALRVSDKADAMLQAQLDVSSAVEHLMATGIPEDFGTNLAVPEERPDWMQAGDPWKEYIITQDATDHVAAYDKVYFDISQENATDPYYKVIVTDLEGMVKVETAIRKEAGT